MPSKLLVFNSISIVLQYSLVILVYYFLARIIKMVYHDLKNPVAYKQERGDMNANQQYARLVVVNSGNINLADTSFSLGKMVSIGRSENNDIVINDTFVSQEHVCISNRKNGYWLSDLNSTNNTYLNGKRVTEEVLLQNKDVIKIGAVTFKFER